MFQSRNQKSQLERDVIGYIPHQSPEPDRDYQSGAIISEVPSSQLPWGVLGFYDPSSHSIVVASDISQRDKHYVKEHESGHGLGYTDEPKTDAYAFSRTGYNPMPFRTAA